MVTKSNQTSEQEEDKGRVKVGKLKVNRETVKDLTTNEQKRIKAGYGAGGRPLPTGGTENVSNLFTCECPATSTPDCYSGRTPC